MESCGDLGAGSPMSWDDADLDLTSSLSQPEWTAGGLPDKVEEKEEPGASRGRQNRKEEARRERQKGFVWRRGRG